LLFFKCRKGVELRPEEESDGAGDFQRPCLRPAFSGSYFSVHTPHSHSLVNTHSDSCMQGMRRGPGSQQR
jgi:hypothetical protein